jgi:hypothetical protein
MPTKNKSTPRSHAAEKKPARAKGKVKKVMREFKRGELHSGSKKGPVVRSRKQAVAIALKEAGVSNTQKRKKKATR